MKITNLLEKNHYKILIILFITIFSVGYMMITYDENKRIKQHLVDKMENTFIQYKLIYNTYKKNAQIIHKNISKNQKIINIFENLTPKNKERSRDELLKIMKPLYKDATKFGVKQLHFHLSNNESFLRMHKPEKYGDNLTHIRYSVAYVNKKHKYISGFEQGRILHGYRYVYPISNPKGQHLGSVEFSIGTKAFEEMFENTLFINSKFIINKKISQEKVFKDELLKHYTQSIESPLYLQGKHQTVTDEKLLTHIKKDIKKYQKKIALKLKHKKAFAIEIHTDNGCFVQSFIPIKNIKDKKIIAYFITSSESLYFKNLHKDSLILKITLLFFTLMIIYIIHRNLNYASELRQEVKRKTDELEESQKRVIQAEKMASLGMLVTGIAHEMNTPIGLSITAITNLLDETKTLKIDYDNQNMDELEFQNYLEKSLTTADIIFVNLVRSAELVKSFKQLSTNQTLTKLVEIDLEQYMNSLLFSLDSKIKTKQVKLKLQIEKTLKITTYPEVLPQIFNNFILNSLTHAFVNIKNPEITIKIKIKNDNIYINYSDNGIGMSKNNLKKIFDPFYTTNRGAGNSGLGMHIIYNLIVDKLYGTIDITSEIDNGVEIEVSLPQIGK